MSRRGGATLSPCSRPALRCRAALQPTRAPVRPCHLPRAARGRLRRQLDLQPDCAAPPPRTVDDLPPASRPHRDRPPPPLPARHAGTREAEDASRDDRRSRCVPQPRADAASVDAPAPPCTDRCAPHATTLARAAGGSLTASIGGPLSRHFRAVLKRSTTEARGSLGLSSAVGSTTSSSGSSVVANGSAGSVWRSCVNSADASSSDGAPVLPRGIGQACGHAQVGVAFAFGSLTSS